MSSNNHSRDKSSDGSTPKSLKDLPFRDSGIFSPFAEYEPEMEEERPVSAPKRFVFESNTSSQPISIPVSGHIRQRHTNFTPPRNYLSSSASQQSLSEGSSMLFLLGQQQVLPGNWLLT